GGGWGCRPRRRRRGGPGVRPRPATPRSRARATRRAPDAPPRPAPGRRRPGRGFGTAVTPGAPKVRGSRGRGGPGVGSGRPEPSVGALVARFESMPSGPGAQPWSGTRRGPAGIRRRKGIGSVPVSVVRRCSRTACRQPAVFTLTYVYADSTAVLGPLAAYVEPHCYDLCAMHAERLTAPRGWEVVRLPADSTGGPGSDDLEALANAVREAARPKAPQRRPQAPPGAVAEGHGKGHLRVVRSDPGSQDQPSGQDA